jgi:hypothetical protein
MHNRRASDEFWIKYLLNAGLLTVDQLQTIRGTQNQVDVGECLCRHSSLFDSDAWINRALQQDRFHYIPGVAIEVRELEEFHRLEPHLYARCLNEGVLPLSYAHQILYLGLLRHDPEFPELKEILGKAPPGTHVCLTPLAPREFPRLHRLVRQLVPN